MQRVDGTTRRIGGFGVEGLERIRTWRMARRRRRAIVVRGHGDEAEILRGAIDEIGEFRLRDRGDRAAMIGEIGELVERRARIGRDRHGAEIGAGVPGDQRLQAIVEMDQHEIARPNSAFRHAGRKPHDLVVKRAIAQRLSAPLERLPDQERMIAPCSRANSDEFGDVEAVERMERRDVHFWWSPRFLHRHCEQRSDEAIQSRACGSWIASLRSQ